MKLYRVKVTQKYRDLELNESLPIGYEFLVPKSRADKLVALRLVQVLSTENVMDTKEVEVVEDEQVIAETPTEAKKQVVNAPKKSASKKRSKKQAKKAEKI